MSCYVLCYPFSPKYPQYAPHSLPMKVSYGVSFVSSRYDQCYTILHSSLTAWWLLLFFCQRVFHKDLMICFWFSGWTGWEVESRATQDIVRPWRLCNGLINGFNSRSEDCDYELNQWLHFDRNVLSYSYRGFPYVGMGVVGLSFLGVVSLTLYKLSKIFSWNLCIA